MENLKFNIETIGVHGSYKPDQTGAKTLPIHQSASFDLEMQKMLHSFLTWLFQEIFIQELLILQIQL
jgi:O-acetylhomoserine/O-acetylserine sulfhydrylase-like pyridoxal-dependent enzyme